MEMDKDQEKLLQAAVAAAGNAYAPYSGFNVGAALLAASGVVYTGANVENASYGLSLCAERSALYTAVAAGERDFIALAIAALGTADAPPCGACRQVLAEFSPNLMLIYRNKGRIVCKPLSQLLPDGFRDAGERQ